MPCWQPEPWQCSWIASCGEGLDTTCSREVELLGITGINSLSPDSSTQPSIVRYFRSTSEKAHFKTVGGERLAPRWVAIVSDAELLTRRTYDWCETWVVQMAYVRKQVVFNLVI